MEGGKLILILKIVVNWQTFGYAIRKISSLRLLSLLLSYIDVNLGDAISLMNLGER